MLVCIRIFGFICVRTGTCSTEKGFNLNLNKISAKHLYSRINYNAYGADGSR